MAEDDIEMILWNINFLLEEGSSLKLYKTIYTSN